MKKKYNIKNQEKKIYNFWTKNNIFNPEKKNKKKIFSIIMPPPNITGNLHIGHAFQQTIMDIIIRYNKMIGKNTLWLMGTDHAGIATQIIVENNLKKKKIKYNKKKLIKELWKWKKKQEKKIYKQTKLIGSSIYWKKTCFSLNKNFSYAVNKVFIKLFNDKLIYKSKKIVFWDTKIKTVISDLEIIKKKKIVKKYYIKFKIFKSKKNIIISTTKPEMLLGITSIIINIHKFKKYKKKYKYLINPINNNLIKIKIINNNKEKFKYIKIIPGHNFKDFKIAKKYNIFILNIFNKNGTLKKKSEIINYNKKNNKYLNLNNPKWIINLNIKKIKKKIINFLYKKKIIEKIKYKKKNIKYSNKSNSIILPLITNQWYIKIKHLSKKAIETIKKKKIIFYPSKYKKLFFSWIKNIKDWCISRQIYWGHKIPIYYDDKKNIYTGYNKKQISKKNKIPIKKIKQEKGVLDTWFSSSLWSFACLGWPKKTINFKLFHPLNLVVSGFDIIFFWITRMIIMTLYTIKIKKINQIPFKKVFITGLIKDENGKKMSKSLGNVIDLEDILNGISLKKLIKKRTSNLINEKNKKKIKINTINKFPNGIKSNQIDVLRFALAYNSTSNLNINFNLNQLKNAYNYCNKLWNIFIYIKKIYKKKIILKKKKIKKLSLIEHWILYKFIKLTKKYKKLIKIFYFNNICKILFNFLKKDFSDWYLESLKHINKKNIYKKKIFLFFIIEKILNISHPITPFITEYIWQKISGNNFKNKKSILFNKIINYNYFRKEKKLINIFNIIQKIIKYIRKYKKKNKKKISKIILIGLNLIEKKIFIKNKYIFKIINIKKIFFINKNIFKKYININKKNNFLKIKKNINLHKYKLYIY